MKEHAKSMPYSNMKKNRKKKTDKTAPKPSETTEATTAAPREEDAAAEDEAPVELTPEERIAELEALLARSRADFANLRRRILADSDMAVARAEMGMLREMLTLSDWLEMALASEVTSPDAVTLKEGVRLTRDQLSSLLTNLGVTEISTEGGFNPSEHQAVATVDDDSAEPGSIASVIRRGFMRKTEVLRHAQVKVVAAPAEEADGQATDAEQTDSSSNPSTAPDPS